MSKDQDPLIGLLQGQKRLPLGDEDQADKPVVQFVKVTRQGYALYMKLEPHGGYSFWTEEIPPALCVYDEGISNPVSMFEALEHLGEAEIIWKHIGEVFGFTQD